MKRLLLLLLLVPIPAAADEPKLAVMVETQVIAATSAQIGIWRTLLGKTTQKLPKLGVRAPIDLPTRRSILDDVRLRKAALLSAPRLAVFNGAKGTMMVLNRVNYIQKYAARKGFPKPQPVVGTVQEGLIIGVRPRVSKDRKQITVEVQFLVRTLVRPIPRHKTPDGTVERPEIKITKGRFSATIQSDGSFIVLGVPHSEPGKLKRQLAIILRAKLIPPKSG